LSTPPELLHAENPPLDVVKFQDLNQLNVPCKRSKNYNTFLFYNPLLIFIGVWLRVG